MKHLLFFPFLLPLGLTLSHSQDPPSPLLPKGWHGTWVGSLVISGPGDKTSSVPLALRIEPIANSRTLTWKTTYGADPKAQRREYRLIPTDQGPNHLRIDEGNGILLDVRRAKNVLYSQFEVEGNWLTARYELRGDTLFWEVTSARPGKNKAQKGMPQPYNLRAIQTAELKKNK